MNTTREFAVGQEIDGHDILRMLPVGTKLTRQFYNGHWITNGNEATRYADHPGEPDQTRPWSSPGGWVSTEWTIAALPGVEVKRTFTVGQRVEGVEALKALPVGTRLVRPHSTLEDLHWITNGDEATRYRRDEKDDTFPWVHGWVHTGWEIAALPEAEVKPPFHVGYRVTTAEECNALPVGTRMHFNGSPDILRTKQADGAWDDGCDDAAYPARLSLNAGYLIDYLPGVTEPTPEVVDEGAESTETVRQFKARFRSLALSAGFSSGIEMELAFRYLEMGGFYPEDFTVGMPVYGEDHDAFQRLPSGTVLQQDTPTNPGLWITDGSEEPDHLYGSTSRDKFDLLRVTYLPEGARFTAQPWVNETMTSEEARVAHREIEALKLLIWDLGNKGRDESEAAGERWCEVFETTLAQVGIDESYARSKGWEAPSTTETVTVTVTVEGETKDHSLTGAEEEGLLRSGLSYLGSPSKVLYYEIGWRHTLSFDREVEQGTCACDEVDRDEVCTALADFGMQQFSVEDIERRCPNC